jgi:deoxyinosine 3'endonuclease (endonuclease V)
MAAHDDTEHDVHTINHMACNKVHCAETTVSLNHRASCADTIDPAKLASWEQIQSELVQQLSFAPLDFSAISTVAGVDISFSSSSSMAVASLVILPYPPSKTSVPRYTDFYFAPMTEPYVAGYLGFRELPHLHALFAKLKSTRPDLYPPDVTLVDGNGIWHPRSLGSASHLGVTLDVPTIGVAKTFYHLEHVGIGHDTMKSLRADEERIVGTDGKTYGAAVRTGGSSKHVFVSCGHKCDLDNAVRLVKACSFYRIPEPIRRADLESRRVIREQSL